ncbi:helix-turn-helix domain-containing protein [Bacillus sp. AGMB 02131]|uniref:Helix-turn-helix domain-containing protein n=1 Tax=Peribacillus faecalis TaxID=2772559 RepID=A0A927CX06_9BACI|nr:helix-turn-helix domain-containing protein [Peribacillus faecalis]MBD3107190.1 helix-turn-helix domain-containing protein [Peribacillus faecalis]
MEKIVLYKAEDIFEQGNLHMANKLKHFGKQGQAVVKYIITKLRKYRGEFFECNETIAENVGCSVRTVQNAIKRAEQLEIFVVSSRKEKTLNGKFRQTSNKIQLLSFEAIGIVKEVVEEVRTVTSKVVKKVANKVKKVVAYKKEYRSSMGYQNTYSTSTRKEIVPKWLKEEYKPPVMTNEEQADFKRRKNELQKMLREKYKK